MIIMEASWCSVIVERFEIIVQFNIAVGNIYPRTVYPLVFSYNLFAVCTQLLDLVNMWRLYELPSDICYSEWNKLVHSSSEWSRCKPMSGICAIMVFTSLYFVKTKERK